MKTKQWKACPHCGASLPAAAAFCPCCAEIVQPRKALRLQKQRRLRLLRLLGCFLAAVVLALLCCQVRKPQTYEGLGEVIYTDEDGTYQLVLGYAEDRFHPVPEVRHPGELDVSYTQQCRLFINFAGNGENAGSRFLQKTESVTTEFIQPQNTPSPMTCSQPFSDSYAPEAALACSIHWTGRSSTGEVQWTIQMKNGDRIQLRQRQVVEPVATYDYDYTEYPMETTGQLQKLLDQIEDETESDAVINIYLPPVIYDGELSITERQVNLYGSSVGENRTTFTRTVQVSAHGLWRSCFHDIDFIGDKSRVGVSASGGFCSVNCRFVGWKTAVLGRDGAWINMTDCLFEDNGVAMHFNSTLGTGADTGYTGNQFINNATAVLLENVPADVMLNFADCIFTGNQTDLDNRCEQPLEISQAKFE